MYRNVQSLRSSPFVLMVVVALASAACSEPGPAEIPNPGAGSGGALASGGQGGAAGAGGAAGGTLAGAGGLAGAAGSGPAAPGTFAHVAGIMQENCGFPACHGGGPDGQDLIFVNPATLYTNLTTKVVMPCNNNILVVPGDPNNSALLKLPTWQCTDFVMPQGCIEDPCLKETELASIRAWITAGAPQ